MGGGTRASGQTGTDRRAKGRSRCLLRVAPFTLQLVAIFLTFTVLSMQEPTVDLYLQGPPFGLTESQVGLTMGGTTVVLIIAAGASQDIVTDDGWTPLVMCARKGHLNMALLLLHAGADGEYTLNGKSCAEIADAKGHPDVAAAIRSHLASASPTRADAETKARRVRCSVSTNALHDVKKSQNARPAGAAARERRGSTLEELRDGSAPGSSHELGEANRGEAARRSLRSAEEYARGLYGGLNVSFRGGMPNAAAAAPVDGRDRRVPSEVTEDSEV